MKTFNRNNQSDQNLLGSLAYPLFSAILSLAPLQAQDMGEIRNFPLFDDEEPLRISLSLDLALFSKKPSSNDSFDAEILIHLNKTDSLAGPVTIKYRGISRYELCTFPPMQLNFRKAIRIDSVPVKKLKLVTHCQSSSINDEYVLREYLVYRMFNILTDTSFRVRLARITYIDSKKNKKPLTKYGILLEPFELLARRTNCMVVKSGYLNQAHIIPAVMDRLAIFNYMVSNWDWSVPGQHNVQVLKPLNSDGNSPGLAVPYDFDLTGVVNADYAIPPENLGIENIRQPIFNGPCRTRETYLADLNRFLEAREEIYQLVSNFKHLNARAKKDITIFLDGFYDYFRRQKNLDNLIDIFLEKCRK